MTVVVTGAAGFIGAAVMRALGPEAVGLTRRAADDRPGGTVHTVDYADFIPPTDAVLVHLAEPRDVGAVEAAGTEAAAATLDLCRRLLLHPWGHVVYVSSAVVYGDGRDAPRRTDETPSPGGLYARTKLAAEAAVLAAGGTVLRSANVYGPGMGPGSVLADVIAQLGRPGPLTLRGDAAAVRDFIHVDDAAAAIAAAARRRPGGVFNVGGGTGCAVGDLARQVLVLAGEPDRPIIAAPPSNRLSRLVLDISQTRRRLDWEPHISLAFGLAMLLSSPP